MKSPMLQRAFGLSTRLACMASLLCATQGCSSSTTTASQDAGSQGDSAGASVDSGSDAGYPHRYGSGEVDAVCEFNDSCKQGLRCECLDGDCRCKAGARGEGRASDPCKTGQDCGSSVCINDEWCSDACEDAKECGSKLTQCIEVIGFSKKICSP